MSLAVDSALQVSQPLYEWDARSEEKVRACKFRGPVGKLFHAIMGSRYYKIQTGDLEEFVEQASISFNLVCHMIGVGTRVKFENC